jgi:hypothetical protein
MKLRGVLTVLAGGVLCAALASPSYAQMKELTGTWVLNHQKSTGPLDKYEDIVWDVKDDGTENYVNHITATDGKKAVAEYSSKLDGKEYPEKHQDGSVTYIVLTQLFPRTEEAKLYKHEANGQSTMTGRFFRVLSHDGKELYDTLCNADGSLIGFRVFDKRAAKPAEAAKAQ